MYKFSAVFIAIMAGICFAQQDSAGSAVASAPPVDQMSVVRGIIDQCGFQIEYI